MHQYNMSDFECQVKKTLRKVQIKKQYNKAIINFLEETEKDFIKADKIRACGNHIGFTMENNLLKITKADFCRQRICNICAWRRQSKFVSILTPVLNALSATGYQFLFATLTVENVSYSTLKQTIDLIMKAYNKFLGRTKINSAFSGIIRSLELSYNHNTNTFHPHLHLLIAVPEKYFTDTDRYISQRMLCEIWKECLQVDYMPICDIRKVNDQGKATVEVLKYALKPSKYTEAIKAFNTILKGRRLLSFSGLFGQYKKQIETAFKGDLLDQTTAKTKHIYLYSFDVSGGIYTFSKQFLERR